MIDMNSSFSWVEKIIGLIEVYGASSIPWNKKEDIELERLIKKSEPGSLVLVVDVLNELAKRSKNKTALLNRLKELKFGWSASKCFVLDLWFPNYVIQNIEYFGDSSDKKYSIRIFDSLSLDILRTKFIICVSEATTQYFDKNQTFVDTVSFVHKHGLEVTNLSSLPLWKFEELYSSASCGHYELTRFVVFDLCRNCINKISKTGEIINRYSTKAPKYLSFHKSVLDRAGKYEGKITVYYGAEVELEGGDQREAIKMYKELNDFIICKEDGTIRTGFEIVTAPATYEIHVFKAKKLFEIIKDQTKMTAKPNCGLHFHVSRNALTTLQVGKMLEFMYNPQNVDFITKIAGRTSSNYAKMSSGKTVTEVAPENFDRESQERYEAINLKNADTIEFRIFASTINYDVYMYRLDFVKALINYTKPCVIGIQSLKEKDVFINFLKENNKEYPFLIQFLGMKKEVPLNQLDWVNKKATKVLEDELPFEYR